MDSLASDKKPQNDCKNNNEDSNEEGWDDDDFILLLPDNWAGRKEDEEAWSDFHIFPLPASMKHIVMKVLSLHSSMYYNHY